MVGNIGNNLQNQVDNWVSHLHAEPSITTADTEELKSHLLDTMDFTKP